MQRDVLCLAASRDEEVSIYLALTACPPTLSTQHALISLRARATLWGKDFASLLLQIRRRRLLGVKPLAQGPTSVCTEAGTRTSVHASPEIAGKGQHFSYHTNALWELPSCLPPKQHHLGPSKRHRIFGFPNSPAKGHWSWEAKVLSICSSINNLLWPSNPDQGTLPGSNPSPPMFQLWDTGQVSSPL